MPKNKATGERTKPGPGRPGTPNEVKAVRKPRPMANALSRRQAGRPRVKAVGKRAGRA